MWIQVVLRIYILAGFIVLVLMAAQGLRIGNKILEQLRENRKIFVDNAEAILSTEELKRKLIGQIEGE